MRGPDRLHLCAFACVVVLIAAACGQKPGVATSGSVLPEGATINEQGQIVDAAGNVIGTADDLSGGGGIGSSAVGGSTTGGTTGGTSSSDTTSGGSAGSASRVG